jgi:hypothetical protein
MQMRWPGCNLPLPGDSNRMLGAVGLSKRGNSTGGSLRLFYARLQSANGVDNVIRMVSPSGGKPEDLNKEGFSR